MADHLEELLKKDIIFLSEAMKKISPLEDSNYFLQLQKAYINCETKLFYHTGKFYNP